MSLELVPLSAHDFPRWMKRSSTEYAADLMTLGAAEKDAQQQATATIQGAFPDDAPTSDNAVFNLVDDAASTVGYLWLGRDNSAEPTSWWVWDIVVDEEHRGKGFGRKAMQLAEGYARSQGATTMGLNVFGFNHAARGLYESLGYETKSIKMSKPLSAL